MVRNDVTGQGSPRAPQPASSKGASQGAPPNSNDYRAAVMNQMNNQGGQPAQVNSPPSQPPRPRPQRGAQPSNMQQGASYNPSSQQQPSRGQRPPQNGRPNPQGRGPRPPQPPQQQDKQGGNGSKNIIIIIIAVVVVAIVGVALFIFSAGSKENDIEPESSLSFEEQMAIEQSIWEQEQQQMPIDEEPIFVFAYTDEEIKALRAAGYTGDEIEFYESMERPAQELIDESDKEQAEYVEKFIAPYYDDTSDEYRRNLKNTWLGLEERKDVADFADTMFTNVETKNLDFEKVPIHGDQIFLKVFLDDSTHDSYFFMSCTPSRYLELGDSGNIVVTYNYIYPTYIDADGIQQEDTTRMFITDAYEVIVSE